MGELPSRKADGFRQAASLMRAGLTHGSPAHTSSDGAADKGCRIEVTGVVQGVGFRPFVYRLAHEERLRGWVRNVDGRVEIEVWGDGKAIARFCLRLQDQPPPLARIEGIRVAWVGAATLPAGTEGVVASGIASAPGNEFVILYSDSSSECSGLPAPAISPDVAVCPQCRRELFDPQDRRYLYPLINCTDCGPRYTIMEGLPYDRPLTSMRSFRMCDECEKEYGDPGDRRFHAQPIACPACGPTVSLVESVCSTSVTSPPAAIVARLRKQSPAAERELFWQRVRGELRSGKVLAVKGLGGFHLACDAHQPGVVRRLRERKGRPHKPLAVMMSDLATVRRYCEVSSEEEQVLLSPAAPILLLRPKRKGAGGHEARAQGHGRLGDAELAWAELIPGLNRVGVMLPYTPLHLLLFDDDLDALVMTSGNESGLPLAVSCGQAWRELRGIADLFLFHNRPILRRLDDSVAVVKPGAGGLQVWRRARGFVPEPVACLSQSLSGYRLGQGSRGAVVNGAVLGGKALNGAAVNGPALTRAVLNGAVLALGAEQNAAFAVLDPSSGRVYPGPHIGDLGTVELEFYMYEQLASFCELLGFTPAAVVVDPHPGYRSRLLGERLAAERDLKLQYVQHHEAHVAAVMAEEGWVGECLGLACDGTGWGSDGRIWGCELFAVDSLALPFRRLAHLQYLPLPGGETAIRRPWRLAAAYTAVLTPDLWPWLEARWPGRRRELRLIPRLVEGLPVQQPATSSLGRLFDAVAGLLGISEEVSYEGQAAMELEALAETIETVEETVADTVVDTVGDTIAAAKGWAEVSGSPGSVGPLPEELEVASLWRGLLTCLQQGWLAAEVALYFQQRVVEMLVGAVLRAAALTGYRRVALGGGCFHNRYLSRRLRDLFERAGFQVAEARRVSPGDGGLAVGQAVLAAARGKWGTASGSG